VAEYGSSFALVLSIRVWVRSWCSAGRYAAAGDERGDQSVRMRVWLPRSGARIQRPFRRGLTDHALGSSG
jgi:hypothetical protein